jgi:uncharacterized protein
MHLLLFLLLAINCQRPENPAEKAVCTHSDLKGMDDEIARSTAALKSKLPAELGAILADTDLPFQRQRNDCSNDESDVAGCVTKVLKERLELLKRAESNPQAARDALGQVRYIDIGFLWKYWPQLAGKKLSVFGCLSLDDPAPRTRATLETENQKSVPVLFKSMPEPIADFLDDQKPCAHWLVEVRRQGDGPLLYADEVLGRPLP